MSTVHCVEVTKFAVSDTAKAAGVMLPLPSLLPAASKTTRICSGWEAQDPQRYYNVRAWDATEAEHNPLLNASAEPTADLPQGYTLEYKIHVHLQCEPFTAIDAPLTEIVTWKLKEHAKREVVEELLTGLMKIVNTIPRSEGFHKAGWGSVLGDDSERQYIVWIGWDNMEAFTTAVANSPDGRAQLHKLAEHADRQIRHMTLQRIAATYEARL